MYFILIIVKSSSVCVFHMMLLLQIKYVSCLPVMYNERLPWSTRNNECSGLRVLCRWSNNGRMIVYYSQNHWYYVSQLLQYSQIIHQINIVYQILGSWSIALKYTVFLCEREQDGVSHRSPTFSVFFAHFSGCKCYCNF